MSETDPKPEPETEDKNGAASDPDPETPVEEITASDTPGDEQTEAAPPEDAPPTPEERIANLEAALILANNDRLLALAEAENAGKRADKRITDNAKYATSIICKGILQVADNLERALLAAPDDLRSQNDLVKNLAVGVEMTAKELTTVLDGQRVSKFVSLNQQFDPNRHQAMQEVEHTDMPAGTIVQVVQEGYMMADRLLRPAMVVVSKGGPKREAQATEDDGEAAGVDTQV
jgi:molecular chaperone GrpE